MVADRHHFDEEQDPDPDLHFSEVGSGSAFLSLWILHFASPHLDETAKSRQVGGNTGDSHNSAAHNKFNIKFVILTTC